MPLMMSVPGLVQERTVFQPVEQVSQVYTEAHPGQVVIRQPVRQVREVQHFVVPTHQQMNGTTIMQPQMETSQVLRRTVYNDAVPAPPVQPVNIYETRSRSVQPTPVRTVQNAPIQPQNIDLKAFGNARRLPQPPPPPPVVVPPPVIVTPPVITSPPIASPRQVVKVEGNASLLPNPLRDFRDSFGAPPPVARVQAPIQRQERTPELRRSTDAFDRKIPSDLRPSYYKSELSDSIYDVGRRDIDDDRRDDDRRRDTRRQRTANNRSDYRSGSRYRDDRRRDRDDSRSDSDDRNTRNERTGKDKQILNKMRDQLESTTMELSKIKRMNNKLADEVGRI